MNFSQEVQDRIAEEGDTITLGEWRRRNGMKLRVRYVDHEVMEMARELRRLQSSSAAKRNY